MIDLYEISSGSVIGSDHKRIGKNNQDAYCIGLEEGAIIAVICDGCSSEKNSEVGSKIASRLIVDSIGRNLRIHYDWEKTLEAVRQEVLAKIRILAMDMGGEFKQTIYSYFLFTVIGTVITRDETIVFSIGDGVFFIDGKKTVVGPFPGNMPPYMTYSLLWKSCGMDPGLLRFNIHSDIINFDNLLIGSDGVNDLVVIEDKYFPGKSKTIGPIEQLWKDNSFFTNKEKGNRWLSLINRDMILPNWEIKYLESSNGLLPDDTTFIVIRRK